MNSPNFHVDLDKSNQKTGGTMSIGKKSVLLAAAALLILVPATLPLGGVSPEENTKIQKNGFDVDIAAFFVTGGDEFATFEPTNLGASGNSGNGGSGGNTQVNDGTLDH